MVDKVRYKVYGDADNVLWRISWWKQARAWTICAKTGKKCTAGVKPSGWQPYEGLFYRTFDEVLEAFKILIEKRHLKEKCYGAHL